MENFYHLLNQSVEVFHRKLSHLIDKYKTFITNVYNKIKDYLINEQSKFSIIEDILKFLKNYNEKYSGKLGVL